MLRMLLRSVLETIGCTTDRLLMVFVVDTVELLCFIFDRTTIFTLYFWARRTGTCNFSPMHYNTCHHLPTNRTCVVIKKCSQCAQKTLCACQTPFTTQFSSSHTGYAKYLCFHSSAQTSGCLSAHLCPAWRQAPSATFNESHPAASLRTE